MKTSPERGNEMDNLKWYVKDESVDREGYICLAIREEQSHRLVCDMADYPNDEPGFVERVREEANIIAHARELLDMLGRVVYAAETKNEPKYRDDGIYRPTIREAYALMDKIKGVS